MSDKNLAEEPGIVVFKGADSRPAVVVLTMPCLADIVRAVLLEIAFPTRSAFGPVPSANGFHDPSAE